MRGFQYSLKKTREQGFSLQFTHLFLHFKQPPPPYFTMPIRFFNGKIIKNSQIFKQDLWVENGIIIEPKEIADQEIDLKGHYLAPGYIDLQINGGFGVDFTTNLADVNKVAKELLRHGVTTFLPTLISSSPENYQSQIPHFIPNEGGMHGARILGLHLEGPFISSHQNGAHSKNFIRHFLDDRLEDVYGTLENVKLITLAPELPGAVEVIKTLRMKEIVISAGHTDASEEQLEEGIQAGITTITHLFNAMASFHHRHSRVVGSVFSHPNLYFSIIADGVHVSDVALQLAWKMNPKGLFLVSDAVALWGMKEVESFLGKSNILKEAKKAYVAETGRLAGGLIGLDGNVKHLRASTGCSVAYAVEAASTKPAQVIGLSKQYGSLNIGYKADMIVLNEKLDIQSTYINGICVFQLADDDGL